MSERRDRGPKPRVRPQMNTETRRHDERSAYHRKAKYRKAPISDDDGELPDEEEGGVLDDLMDGTDGVDEIEAIDEAPKPPRKPRSRG